MVQQFEPVQIEYSLAQRKIIKINNPAQKFTKMVINPNIQQSSIHLVGQDIHADLLKAYNFVIYQFGDKH